MMPSQTISPEPKIYEISDEPTSARVKTVLVLEDDGDFAGMLKQMLEDQGYRLTVAASGAQGLRKVVATDFDAIVCDVVMPYCSGDVFYKALQRLKPHLCDRVVFITGHKSNPEVAAFIEQTGRMALWKPFRLAELFNALEIITGRKQ